jgi:putative ABC transport system ATP-binding protein
MAVHAPMQTLRRLSKGAKGEGRALVIYAVGSGIFSLAVPVAAQALLESVAFTSLLPQVIVLTGLVGMAMLASLAMTLSQTFLVELMSRRVFVHALREGTRRILDAAISYDSTTLTMRAARFYDVISIEKSLAMLATDGLAVALQIALGMVLLALYHPLLLALDLALVVLLSLVVFSVWSRALATARRESVAKHEAAGFLIELARRESHLRGGAVKNDATRLGEKLADEWLMARAAHFRLHLLQIGGALFLQVLTSIVVLGVGGFLVIVGELSLGQLAAAEIVVALTVGAIARGGKLLGKVYDLIASTEKIETLLELESDVDPGASPDGDGAASLTLEGDDGSVIVEPGSVKQISIDDRERVISALRSHMQGTFSETRLRIDGIDLRAWARGALRDRVVVTDDLPAAEGRVHDVVTRLAPDASPLVVANAIEAMGLGKIVFGHEGGLGRDMRSLHGATPEAVEALRLAALLVANPRAVIVGSETERRAPGACAQLIRVLEERTPRPTLVFARDKGAPARVASLPFRQGDAA